MHALRASAAVMACSSARDDAHAELMSSEAAWADALPAGRISFDPQAVAAWGGVVLANEAALRQSDLHLTEAELEKTARSEEWGAAHARADGAQQIARAARRREQRRREEVELAEAADRISMRAADED